MSYVIDLVRVKQLNKLASRLDMLEAYLMDRSEGNMSALVGEMGMELRNVADAIEHESLRRAVEDEDDNA